MASHRFMAALIFTASFVMVPAFSQIPATISVVRGEIRSAEPLQEGDLTVRLLGVSGGRPFQQASVEFDGSFEFRDVAVGSYRFQLLRLPDQLLIDEVVEIRELGAPLRFDLPKQARASHSGAAKVSVRQLRHPPSKAAMRAFADARRDSAAGNHTKAIEELRVAVARAPEFAEAWSNLGVQYSILGQSEAAIGALEEAARLMPDEALIHTNLSYAYCLASRWDRAEAEARRALQLDKNYARARYILGVVLLMRGVSLDEAVENLSIARDEVPRARLVLAGYYLRNARREAAEQELRAYIAATKGDDQAKAERWLAELNRDRTGQDSAAASSLLPRH